MEFDLLTLNFRSSAMGKTVQQAHITGESGVIKFKDYCNRHKPFIIFREIKEHDYGVDGEVELVKLVNEKLVASGKVIKVQLKSTASVNSYIRSKTETGFSYYASNDDFEYWTQHNLGVILVIYDSTEDRLFAKKITKEEYAYNKKHSLGSAYPIQFAYKDNELFTGEGVFFDKVNLEYFKPRVDKEIEETLVTNVYPFSSFPKKMYIFDTELPNKKAAYSKLDEGMTLPPFVLYNKKIYSFLNIASWHKTFRENIVSKASPNSVEIFYREFYDEKSILNHYVELINLYLKLFFTNQRRLWLNRDQRNNYFFPKPSQKKELKIKYKTMKRGTTGERTVVNYYEYGKDKFFRHFGFAYYIDFIERAPVLLLNYKYHFTFDGMKTLPPLKVTSLTNKLTLREFNNQVLNHHYFWFEYLSEGSYIIDVESNEIFKIRIKEAENLKSDFGIYKPKNIESAKIKPQAIDNNQTSLF